MRRYTFAALFMLAAVSANAEEKTAEQLVAGKKKANITYRQLMEMMGSASIMIHEGIVRENPQMVRDGANLIVNHPAPNHKPWTIVAESDQAAFKQSLLIFDKIMDNQAEDTASQAEQGRWLDASTSAHALMNSCISCHAGWKAKAK
jgi:hypothetical protein